LTCSSPGDSPVVLGEGRGRARVDLLSSHEATVSLALRFATPTGSPRYLNIVPGARMQINGGRVAARPVLAGVQSLDISPGA
jgi:hypothetical protein